MTWNAPDAFLSARRFTFLLAPWLVCDRILPPRVEETPASALRAGSSLTGDLLRCQRRLGSVCGDSDPFVLLNFGSHEVTAPHVRVQSLPAQMVV